MAGEKYKAGMNIVLLDPDVAKVSKTPRSVNQALRSLAKNKKHNTNIRTRRNL